METKQREKTDPFRRQRIAATLCALAVLLGSLWIASLVQPKTAETVAPAAPIRLVLDPGHGGVDGGAIAYNGVKESDLNLAIALRLRDLAAFYGLETSMTREDDRTLSDAEHYSEHEDLVSRAAFLNAEGGLCLSIHQNTFPTSQPRGAQVLYGAGEESRRLGQQIQNCIVSSLQPENRRVAEPASSGLYLPSHVEHPFALVECGFLSNLSELQELSSERYQKSFAAVLLCACLQYASGRNTG